MKKCLMLIFVLLIFAGEVISQTQDGIVRTGLVVQIWSIEDFGKPISENTMIFALYRLGYHSRQTVHGFRRLASTWANEQLVEYGDQGVWIKRYHEDWIELQLAHSEKNAVRGAKAVARKAQGPGSWQAEVPRWLAGGDRATTSGACWD